MASSAPTLHRLAPEVYDRMVASGALDGEHVELVDGLLVHVTPQGADHAALVQRLTVHFASRADLLRVRMPLAVPGGRPEPDVALTETVSSREHPHSAALVVEVAVTSRDDDLIKLPGYAQAGVATVWLVDVNARAVRVFADPQPAERRYARERGLHAGDALGCRRARGGPARGRRAVRRPRALKRAATTADRHGVAIASKRRALDPPGAGRLSHRCGRSSSRTRRPRTSRR